MLIIGINHLNILKHSFSLQVKKERNALSTLSIKNILTFDWIEFCKEWSLRYMHVRNTRISFYMMYSLVSYTLWILLCYSTEKGEFKAAERLLSVQQWCVLRNARARCTYRNSAALTSAAPKLTDSSERARVYKLSTYYCLPRRRALPL